MPPGPPGRGSADALAKARESLAGSPGGSGGLALSGEGHSNLEARFNAHRGDPPGLHCPGPVLAGRAQRSAARNSGGEGAPGPGSLPFPGCTEIQLSMTVSLKTVSPEQELCPPRVSRAAPAAGLTPHWAES